LIRIRLLSQEAGWARHRINGYLRGERKIWCYAAPDLLFRAMAIEQLVAPFATRVGRPVSRAVPVNDPGQFIGLRAHML